ncbi:MAG: SUMF1/EgtB/PvdO family nonheme iron enzyme [Candidatus Eremiobacteraeota bacterium]|nr:SUMF1/EgtB/PvdO family nonheme iron enzyme [Candidatus Eremiobacteraeota bacterium]MCW5868349.1 SUMF1/EgtB/PvdO family nonheme iron enzyme [Candidatus Eremiobacteraeota bacterium]
MAGLEPQSLEGEEVSDRIRVTKLRAIGWIGYVYQGEMLSLGRPVASCAVKLIHPRPMCSPETLLQDLREQARFVHPHLLALQHSGLVREGVARDWIYLTSELADYSIQDLLTRGSILTPTQVREFLVQLLEALRYLHAQGIVHGEIRPPNVLSTTTGWRLSGLEYRGTLSRRLEELGYNQNHFVFRAPEAQERGADHSSADIWSLAVVAHAALTGRLPFDEEESRDRSDLLWRIVNQDPQFEHLEEPFDRLMTHCLVREPRLRWTAEQALACLSGRPVLETYFEQIRPSGYESPAPPEPEPEPLVVSAPPPPPSSSPLYVGLCVALLLVGLFIGKFLLPPPPKKVMQVNLGDLVNQEYSVAHLDDRGRITTQPAVAPVLSEDLGEGIHLDLVQIPGADFEQGASEAEVHRELDESPRHPVRISNFYIGRFEVTQAQWALALRMPSEGRTLPMNPWTKAGSDLPVHTVTWNDANEFCRRLTRYTGRVHRLPTEAEWEYTCRGGPVDTPFHYGPVLTDQVANFNPDPPFTQSIPMGMNRNEVVSVETYPYASHFGLYQLHGNVKEWCLDFYGPYSKEYQDNPRGPRSGEEKVLRGGGFRSPAANCRTSARYHEQPNRSGLDTGFRVVVPEVVAGSE